MKTIFIEILKILNRYKLLFLYLLSYLAELKIYTIPMNYLDEIYTFSENIINIENEILLRSFFKNVTKLRLFLWTLNYPFWLKDLEKLAPLLPSNSGVFLSNYSDNKSNEIWNTIMELRNNESIMYQLSKLTLLSISIKHLLQHEEYLFIWDVLSYSNIKRYISSIEVELDTLTEAFKILDLLSDWMNIKIVYLKYSSAKEISNINEAIAEAKETFVKRIGIISKLKIYC